MVERRWWGQFVSSPRAFDLIASDSYSAWEVMDAMEKSQREVELNKRAVVAVMVV